MDNKIFIIDFDSTFIQVEALEELAAISLAKNPAKKRILDEITALTNAGIDGKMSFTKSLEKRIELLNANKSHLDILVKRLKRKISVSVARNRDFFKKYSGQIYIISGGFHEFIHPIVKQFGIAEKNIFANTFIFDAQGQIVGFDKANILAKENGKVELLKSLHLNGDIYIIGDGYTEYQIKEAGLANRFFAFTENIQRENILSKADHITPSFDEFLFLNKLPMAISYPKNRINVLLLENIHPDAVAQFRAEGYNVEMVPSSLDEDELAEKIKQVSVLGVRSKTKVSARVLSQASRLIAMGAFCIGTDGIDLSTCSKDGVAVFNAPFSNTRSVVELTLGEIIVLMRNILPRNNKLHQGIWEKSADGNYEIRGKKLGIVGYGKIGSQLSILAESLGMDVYYFDVVEKLALGNARQCDSLRKLLRKVDIVSVHVDGNPNNKNLFSEIEFKTMKRGAIFLNLSRGFVVDAKALVKYLKNGKIKGAAIDVFHNEPKNNSEPFISELQNIPNVILTPHIGGSTVEAQKNIAEFVTDKIISYINSGNSFYSVNFPKIQLPKLIRAHRLIHVHENLPGILAQINSVLASYHINIVGQYLKTNEEIGYVITDIAKDYEPGLIKDLKKIPHTIKFRILY